MPRKFTLVVFGSREKLNLFRNLHATFDRALGRYDPDTTRIIHGAARGIDLEVGAWCELHGFEVVPFPVTEVTYSRYPPHERWRAPLDRNTRMASEADGGVGFWTMDRASTGTLDMTKKLHALGLPFTVYTPLEGAAIIYPGGDHASDPGARPAAPDRDAVRHPHGTHPFRRSAGSQLPDRGHPPASPGGGAGGVSQLPLLPSGLWPPPVAGSGERQ